jgi:hypothetical protein
MVVERAEERRGGSGEGEVFVGGTDGVCAFTFTFTCTIE